MAGTEIIRERLQAQPLVRQVHAAVLATDPEAVLVGGAVRDLVLGRGVKDLDYVVPRQGMAAARRLADALGGAYYALDPARDVGRVILRGEGKGRLVIDIARRRGPDLDADLADRDFTINAIALLPAGRLYDPLQGLADLEERRLRPCSPHSLLDDPLRVLRAVRLLFLFRLQPAAELDDQAPAAAADLWRVSAERRRDELLNILALPEPHYAIWYFQTWGLTQRLLPDLAALRGLQQPAPHVFDAYEHSLTALRWAARLDRLLCEEVDPADDLERELVRALTPYRRRLADYLEQEYTPGRPRWLWLRLAALAHDWGKPATRSQDDEGRIRFLGHEQVSAELVAAWMQDLRCSGNEIAFVRRLCLGHMRPLLLSQAQERPSRRSLYRFYRDQSSAGPATVLLHIADFLATYGSELAVERLRKQLGFAAAMLEAGLTRRGPGTRPLPLLDGREIMALLGLPPGPPIGRLLEALREAQAVGEVRTREEAIAFIKAQKQQLTESGE